MGSERTQPQLVMRRPHLRDLPLVQLAEGYTVRSFRDGDEAAWEHIIAETFETSLYRFDRAMRSDPAFAPERVLLITCGDEPVATASAWRADRFGPNTGYLHMVGVLPGHQGKHLGAKVSLAALRRFVEEGRIDAVLQTDDFRLPAIRTYLRLGFEPLPIHENQRQRWRAVFDEILRPDLVRQFQPTLDGPIARVEGLS